VYRNACRSIGRRGDRCDDRKAVVGERDQRRLIGAGRGRHVQRPHRHEDAAEVPVEQPAVQGDRDDVARRWILAQLRVEEARDELVAGDVGVDACVALHEPAAGSARRARRAAHASVLRA
jgi:hypothetical protein